MRPFPDGEQASLAEVKTDGRKKGRKPIFLGAKVADCDKEEVLDLIRSNPRCSKWCKKRCSKRHDKHHVAVKNKFHHQCKTMDEQNSYLLKGVSRRPGTDELVDYALPAIELKLKNGSVTKFCKASVCESYFLETFGYYNKVDEDDENNLISIRHCIGPDRITSLLDENKRVVYGRPKSQSKLPEVADKVFEFLATLPSIPLHYLRKNKKSGRSLRYLCTLEGTLRQLYDRFIRENPERKKSGKALCSKPTFNKIFLHSGLTLTKPKSDHCGQCMTFKNEAMRCAKTKSKMDEAFTNKQVDHEAAIAFTFEEFAHDCQNPDKVTCLSADYRKKQQIPLMPQNEMIPELERVTRLACSNFTVTNTKLENGELVDKHMFTMSAWPAVPRDAGGTLYSTFKVYKVVSGGF